MVKNSPAIAGDAGSISGWGRSPGVGNSNPLQYSCLGNPMDRGALQAPAGPWTCKRVRQLSIPTCTRTAILPIPCQVPVKWEHT